MKSNPSAPNPKKLADTKWGDFDVDVALGGAAKAVVEFVGNAVKKIGK